MNKTMWTTFALSAAIALSGCGGGSDNPTTASTVNTGTGYYLDSAVEGIDYTCGSQSGKTDKDGKFVFEEGKECQFTLADIPVKTIPADKLVDGVKIVEDDPKVAKFLQSIDSDGNLTNGITIDEQVLEALTTALETVTDKAQVIEDETVMAEVVATVGEAVEDVSGELRSDAEVEAHLTQTQTEVTKALLAGKTFWMVLDPENDIGEQGELEVAKVSFNTDANTLTIVSSRGTKNYPILITANKMVFEDTDGSYTLITQADGYIDADDRNADGTKDGIGHRLYTDKADAEAYLKSLTSGSSSASLADIVGKTFYQHCNDDGHDSIDTLTFQSNGIVKIVEEDGDIDEVPYEIDGNTIYTTENGQRKLHTLIERTDKYIKMDDGNGYSSTFYFNRSDAQNAPADDCGDDGDS